LIGAIIAFSVHNINEIWSWITGSLSAGLFGPILLRWYWWRFNGIGFAVSTGVGLTASILAKLLLHSWPFYLTFALVLSVSIIAGIIASYLTPAVDEEVLNTFYKKIKPFGLWKPQEASCKVNFLSKIKSEHVRDFVNVIVAICWHLSMFLFFICLVLWKWEIVIPCLFIVTVTSIILYFNWYKYLSDDDYQEEDFPEGEAPLTT
jgi:hypothetical protein